MHSCIYEGTIRHRRFRPRPNRFQYRLFFMLLDLAELPTLFDIHGSIWPAFAAGITSVIREFRWIMQ